MEFENEKLGVKFALPDKMTVRQELAYRQALLFSRDEAAVWVQFWQAVQPLIEDWECELIPDPKELDLDAPAEDGVADIVQWVSDQAGTFMLGLGNVPKNK